MQQISENALSYQTNSTAKHLLTFTLGKEEYAIDILAVKRICSYQVTVAVTHCPEFVKGLVKLEDDIALIVDLRVLFDVTPVTYNDSTLMILLNVQGHVFSIVIDEVLEVVPFSDKQRVPSDELSALADRHYIQGLANIEERLIILLDVEKLFSQELVQLVKKVKHDVSI